MDFKLKEDTGHLFCLGAGLGGTKNPVSPRTSISPSTLLWVRSLINAFHRSVALHDAKVILFLLTYKFTFVKYQIHLKFNGGAMKWRIFLV